MRRLMMAVPILLFMLVFSLVSSFAQTRTEEAKSSSSETPDTSSGTSGSASPAPAAPIKLNPVSSTRESPIFGRRWGVGVRASTLGPGVEVATALTWSTNLRVGFNALPVGTSISGDGLNWGARLNMKSVETHFDYFLWRGFHVSPGALIWVNQNLATANVTTTAGNSFSLNNASYVSSATTPVGGSATLGVPNRVAPTLTVGFGNLVPRTKHFNYRMELGAAYTGPTRVAVGLTGQVCTQTSISNPPYLINNCQNAASDTSFQQNVAAEQGKIDKSLSPFRFFPIFSFGFGYAF